MRFAEKLREHAEKYKRNPLHNRTTVELLEKAAKHIDMLTELNSVTEDIEEKCISHYGADAQVDMAIEEMSELTKALLKLRRAKHGETADARIAIIDELADVRIMVDQMELLYQCRDDVRKRIFYKIGRQKRRLEEMESCGKKQEGSSHG